MRTRKPNGGGPVRLSESKLKAIIAESIKTILNEAFASRALGQFVAQHGGLNTTYMDKKILFALQQMTDEEFNQRFIGREDAGGYGGKHYGYLTTDEPYFILAMNDGTFWKFSGIGLDWGSAKQQAEDRDCRNWNSKGYDRYYSPNSQYDALLADMQRKNGVGAAAGTKRNLWYDAERGMNDYKKQNREKGLGYGFYE